MNPSFEENINHTCTGCGACVNACRTDALKMVFDDSGFAYPKLVKSCLGCQACLKACPLGQSIDKSEEGTIYAALATDDSIRLNSSSGGIFSLLAMKVLQNGGCVYGASFDEKYSVRHIGIETIEELSKLQGAKYAQSDIGYCFREIQQKLKLGREILFSGTPCQVAGLNFFLGRKWDNLLLVDIVCHSMPSPKVWENYVKFRAEKDAGGRYPKSINLRSKHTGWSDYSYSNVYVYDDERKFSVSPGEDVFMKLFLTNSISRESCANCRFRGFDRISDITLGDFWGIWDVCPQMNDNKGTSLLIVHSKKGEEFLCKIKKDSLKLMQFSKEEALKYNPAIVSSSSQNENRSAALTLALAGKFECLNFVVPRKKKKIFAKIKFKVRKALLFLRTMVGH